jgi:branched-chain amino acid transport system ATP-binding protein
MTTAPRIVVLNRGQVIADGAPERIAKDPGVIKAYLGQESAVA